MQGFAKSMRLLNRKDFDETFANGKKVVGRSLVAVTRPNASGPRLGLVVSRKVGNAVVRNQVKRKMREIFRLKQDVLPKTDFVIIARRSSAELPYVKLAADFDRCLEQAGD